MKYKVTLKDGKIGEIECDDYDDAPDAAWKKYGKNWDKINKLGMQT